MSTNRYRVGGVAIINRCINSSNADPSSPIVGSGIPGGLEGQLQYISNYNFSGAAHAYYDPSVNQLRIQDGKLLLSNSTFSITGVTNTGAFSIRDNSIDILRVDTLNRRLYFDSGTGYFLDLYSNNLKVATEYFVTGMSGVLAAKNDFKFFSTNISMGQNYQDIPYPVTLSYTPKLIADFRNTNINFNIFYSCELTNITNTGFRATFSDIIRETGNVLTVFVGSSYY